MLHPSYGDLMSRVNDRKEREDQLRSRYSIVIATAKRARQLVAGDEALVEDKVHSELSIAIKELYDAKIDIV